MALGRPLRTTATAVSQDCSADSAVQIRPIEKKTIKDFIENAWKEVRMLEVERLRKEAAQKTKDDQRSQAAESMLQPRRPERSGRSPGNRSIHSQGNSSRAEASRSGSEANLPPLPFAQTTGFNLSSQVQERRLAAGKINQTLAKIQERQKLSEERLAEERELITKTLKRFEKKSILWKRARSGSRSGDRFRVQAEPDSQSRPQ